MTQSTLPPPTDGPPKTSHKGAIVATTALMLIWAVLTFGAHRVAPMIAAVAESVEVGLGFDVLPGTKE